MDHGVSENQEVSLNQGILQKHCYIILVKQTLFFNKILIHRYTT